MTLIFKLFASIHMMRSRQVWIASALGLMAIVLAGCAKNPAYPEDPYEKYNRAMFTFNSHVDRLIYRPITTVYTTITPPPLQKGIHNVFVNVGTLTTIPNDLLQGKIKYTVIDTWRFIINSTIGVGGLFDVASRLGFPKHHEDFGMTLAYYSDTNQSPYFILPFLGPSTVRDAVAEPVDYVTTPFPYIHATIVNYGAPALRLIDTRADLMPTNKLLDTSFDPYALMRSAYLQKRAELIRQNRHDFVSSYHQGNH